MEIYCVMSCAHCLRVSHHIESGKNNSWWQEMCIPQLTSCWRLLVLAWCKDGGTPKSYLTKQNKSCFSSLFRNTLQLTCKFLECSIINLIFIVTMTVRCLQMIDKLMSCGYSSHVCKRSINDGRSYCDVTSWLLKSSFEALRWAKSAPHIIP